MLATSIRWEPGWHGIWIVLVLVVLIAPIVFGGKYRFTYCVSWCVILMAVVGFLWVRNHGGAEKCTIRFSRQSPVIGEFRDVSFFSGTGNISLSYSYEGYTDLKFLSEAGLKSGWHISWSRGTGTLKPKPYPVWQDGLYLRGWGFDLAWYSDDEPELSEEAAAAGATFLGSRDRLYGVGVPSWFALVMLSIVPMLYPFHIKRRRVRQWIASGCCAHCGYDLRAHKLGDKCPECGVLIALPTKPNPPASRNIAQP